MEKNITNKEVTKVKFLLERDDNFNKSTENVFAYFPEELYNPHIYGKNVGTAYSHIGQHSACHYSYAKVCEKATPDQYNNLKTELESIGYNLQII